jgi:phosphatidylserine/phosphatidylglycerophosphate/cardiolipin synthase-like enzyme
MNKECVYIGSANITSAAIGKRASGKRNHEAGMLLWGEDMIEAPLCHFDRVWDDPDILKHTWKRFATKAKEWEKGIK